MKKLVTIIGARPQFIKAAILSRLLHKDKKLKEVIVHTGQHYDANMSKIFFDELEIPAIDYQLNIGSGSHGTQTAAMLLAIEKVLLQENPDFLLIYGDTNSTLAGALAGAKLHIPIAHVESGLRSYNRKMPEEVNRIIADQLSTVLFTPTKQAFLNLKREGYLEKNIVEVGDIMYDAALFYAGKAKQNSKILNMLGCAPKNYILATIHRAENTNDLQRLITIFTAFENIANTIPLIIPLHPRTHKLIESNFPNLLNNTAIQIIEPVGFLDMIMLEQNAALIITDSGGIQKEAFFYQIPCITLRDETEWLETIKLGWNIVIKPDNSEDICKKALQSLGAKGITGKYPYGKGKAGQLIFQYLKENIT